MTTNLKIKALIESLTTEIEAQIRASALEAVTRAFGGAVALPAAVKTEAKTQAKSAAKAPKKRKAKRAKAAKATPVKATAPKATPAKGKVPIPGNKGAKRSPADRDRDVGRLVAFVKSNPGATTEKARAALGIAKGPWKVAMGHAIETKQLAKKGQRRDTTLHVG